MTRQATRVAFAFVGLVVGAGFASGQEVLQYFVGFGYWGIVGAAVAALIFAVSGMAILQLGSYFLASDHNVVITGVTRPLTSKLFDVLIVFTLFSMGFVMIAGGGANMHQQWGLPVWVGSAVISVFVIAAGMLDVRKVTAVIGAMTPVMVIFVIGAFLYSVTHIDSTFAHMNASALEVGSTLPHWTLAVINYVPLALVLAVSMSLVMGGDILNPKVAGWGGFFGGLLFGVLLTMTTVAMFIKVDDIADYDMPLMQMVNLINPWLGTAMAIVIFLMIFNTAIGMYYALASRFGQGNSKRFKLIIVVNTVLGFGLSFFGFKNLVAYLYPIIGYAGLILVGLLVFRWWSGRAKIAEEQKRRGLIRLLMHRKLRRDKAFTRKHDRQLAQYIEDSPIDNEQLHHSYSEEVSQQLDDAGIDHWEDADDAPISR